MEADECISISSTVTAKNQLTINDLDDDSLGIIFNKLPYIDRMRIESVCQRWCAISTANWCTYSKCLTIGADTGNFLPAYDDTTDEENKHILEKVLQRSGLYLEEIIFIGSDYIWRRLPTGTIKWIAELCPNLKRLKMDYLILLNYDDWLACSNLEELSFTCLTEEQKGDGLGILFRNNKRLRRLTLLICFSLTASDFNHLDPGQLEFLQIEYCRGFEFTAQLTDKLAESLVELRYNTIQDTILSTPNFQHLGKLKNLRCLDLQVKLERFEGGFIGNIAKNCQKLERLLLSIHSNQVYDLNAIVLLFDLPYLRRLIIIVEEKHMPYIERDRLLQRATHLEFFVIETCDKCEYGSSGLEFCYRHHAG